MNFSYTGRILAAMALAGILATGTTGAQTSNRTFAVAIEKAGLPNLHKVSDVLYRGAQPEAGGFAELERMGIKTVINLRHNHDDASMLKGTSLRYVRIPINTWNLDTNDIVRFLKTVADTNNQPVFVHCQHGADRTGTMCAMYRMAVEGWTKNAALEEMTNGGFGYHEIWDNLIELIRKTDIEALKKP